MRIGVIGAGGVGGYFGGRLAAAGHEVGFVARGRHLEAMQRHGLTVRSVHGDFRIAEPLAGPDPSQMGERDVVLFTVKAYDTEEAARGLGGMVGPTTAVVSLQNGIDNEERIAGVIGLGHVVGGAAYVFSTIAEPGVISHIGGPTSIVVGELGGSRSERLDGFVDACRDAGFEAEVSTDIRRVLWSKLAFICAQAGTTAAIRLPIGDILASPASRDLFRVMAAEVCAVAAAEGVDLPADLPDRHLAFAEGLEPGAFSSLHHDLVSGRRMELEALVGEVVRRGERSGVPTPACETIYAVLQPWHRRVGSALPHG